MKLLKDSLTEQVAEHMELPLELIEAVIKHQGEDAAQAVKIHNEIEFSGLGKFFLSLPRTKRRLFHTEKKLQEGRVKEEDKEKYLKHIEELKRRIGHEQIDGIS